MWIHWPFFPKTWTKGHWPLDDLWPHVCWGHTCDSTQGSLSPSPMGIYQCMWIQWSILQITTYIHTYTYIHTTYILRTYYVQNEWLHSLLLNSVQARQKARPFTTYTYGRFLRKWSKKNPLASFFESLFSNLSFCLLECTHLEVYRCKIATP